MGQIQLDNMEGPKEIRDWPLSTICWYAVFVWFGASLFSQSLYMAFNGEPYNANIILESAGPFAWLIITIEVLVWGIVVLFFGRKVVNRFQSSPPEIALSENVSPQS